MATKLKSFKVESFVGGYNAFANKTNIKDDESPDMINMDFVGIRGLKKRRGYSQLSGEVSNGNKITSVFAYLKNDGSNELLGAADTHIYKWNGSSWSAVSGGTITAASVVNTAQVGDKLFIMTGQDALQYYDGTNLSTTGITLVDNEPANPSFGILFGKRLICNSTTSGKEHMFWASGAITSAGATTNVGDFRLASPAYGALAGYGEGRNIAAFGVLKNYLYTFLSTGEIHQLSYVGGESGALTFSDSTVSNFIGCVGARAIDNVENDLFFVWRDGIYSLGEVANYTSIRTKNISGKIENIVDSISSTRLSSMVLQYYNERLYVAYTSSGTINNAMLVYDTRYRGWLPWDSIRASDLTKFIDSDNQEHLYFSSSDSTDSYCYELESTSNDNNAAISSKFLTKCFSLDEFSIQKLFFDARILFGPVLGAITIKVHISDGSSIATAQIGSATTYSDGIGSRMIGDHMVGATYNTPDNTSLDNPQNDFRVFDIDAEEGTNIQFEFSNENINENFQIEEIIGYFKPLGDRYVDPAKEI